MLNTTALERPAVASRCWPVKFLAVIGLYKISVDSSPSFRTLKTSATRLSAGAGSLSIVLYDNTPGPGATAPLTLPPNVRYHSTGYNAGLADAFNFGLKTAIREGFDWLITLDQDTELPSDFIECACDLADQVRYDPSIAAIVPQIVGDGKVLSPNWFWAGAVPRWFPTGYIGVPEQPTFAFNSASVLRVSALREIGGYDSRFWLDNSDAAMYHALHRYGKRVFVAGNIRVNHHFSMLNLAERMTPSRYHNALMAETAFWDLAMNPLAAGERMARLLGRFCKQVLRADSAELRNETARALKRRLFHSRRSRIQEWQRELKAVVPPIPRPECEPDVNSTPKISVCVATCNGRRFVSEQIDSVLKQISSDDEVIVVDDASEDGTQDIITSKNDPRIRIIEHSTRQGVVKTFEHAVRAASGDIVFLCDQDDLWAPNKVSRMMEAFASDPEVMIVTSKIRTIDENGNAIVDDVYSHAKPFTPSIIANLLSNRFQGAAMAFRTTLIPRLLPFPRGFHLLHDAWIGTRNTITGGKTLHLDEELLFYRRHSQNASRKLGFVDQLLKRVRLLVALATRWCQDKWRGDVYEG